MGLASFRVLGLCVSGSGVEDLRVLNWCMVEVPWLQVQDLLINKPWAFTRVPNMNPSKLRS